MKNSLIPVVKVGVYVALLAAIAFGTDALAKKPGGGGGGGCPRDIQCPDIWDPVICSDGVVYSNDCYAFRACATGCVPYGDGGPIQASAKARCPRDVQCPDVWDPVICNNGVVYSNGCYAYQQCATGCVPYGDGGPIPAVNKG